MKIPAIKNHIDYEVEKLNNCYGTICLAENRDLLNLQDCQSAIFNLRISLDNLETEIQKKIGEKL